MLDDIAFYMPFGVTARAVLYIATIRQMSTGAEGFRYALTLLTCDQHSH